MKKNIMIINADREAAQIVKDNLARYVRWCERSGLFSPSYSIKHNAFVSARQMTSGVSGSYKSVFALSNYDLVK